MNASFDTTTPLPQEFFMRDTLVVAQELLGTLLVRRINDEILAGRIVETEAYVGKDDLACHASRGRTERTEVMFGEAGYAYVYLIYGMYHCLNIVTEKKNFPAAVLIRAVEPIQGIEIMRRNRWSEIKNSQKDTRLANGPGKLCAAMTIDRSLNNINMCTGETLWIADGQSVAEDQIATSPRIGVDYAGECAAWPWRFMVKESVWLSR